MRGSQYLKGSDWAVLIRFSAAGGEHGDGSVGELDLNERERA